MTADELIALTKAFGAQPECQRCAALVCKGWESLPGAFERSSLRCVGTLRDAGSDEPTFAEYHPAGTHGWSHNAPIALGWFRIRELQVGLIHEPSSE